MTKKEISERNQYQNNRVKENNDKSHLSLDDKLAYIQRLMQPYQKSSREYFLFQYLEGDGNELKDSFWSVYSSSRFAFELYSWMANDDRVKEFAFERKLVGLRLKGRPTPPNMDVYLEIDDRVIFIESKLTEEYTFAKFKISSSYYKKEGDIGDSGKKINMSLVERYQNKEKIAEEFREFIERTTELLKNNAKKVHKGWMEFRQEITHLVGIALTVATSNGKYREKNIEFYNVYYEFGDEIYGYIGKFFEEAQERMTNLLVKEGLCKGFIYRPISAQNLVAEKTLLEFKPDTKAYASNKTIGDILKEQFCFDPWNK